MLRAPLPSPPLPGGESGGLGLVRRYLTSALLSRSAAAKARDWKSLLANSQSRRLMCDQSKKSKLFSAGFGGHFTHFLLALLVTWPLIFQIAPRRRRRCRKGMGATSLNRRVSSDSCLRCTVVYSCEIHGVVQGTLFHSTCIIPNGTEVFFFIIHHCPKVQLSAVTASNLVIMFQS
jgi:hypothetical protein